MKRNYPQYVQVSPDAPDSWWDPKSGMWFRKEDKVIQLKDGLDAGNIIRYLRYNYLIDVTSLVEPPVVEAEQPQVFVEKTAKQLLKEQEQEAQIQALMENTEVQKEEKPSKIACPHCGKECVPKGLPNHIKFCKENPENQQE
jgi:hypothetical protein